MTWNLFASLATINSNFWDQNFNQLAGQSLMPCSVAGTNTLTLTPLAGTPPVSAYANYQSYYAVSTATNTGASTAQVGALAALNIYRDTATGPVALTGGEMFLGNEFILTYDSALNAGAGGFHLVSGPGSGLGTFLPLAGGTLTGPLKGTTISISGPLTAVSGLFSGAVSVATIVSTGQASAVSLAINAGTPATRLLSTTASITYTTIAPGATQDQTIALVGASLSDIALLGPPSAPTAGIVFTPFVSATGVITVRAANVTAASVLPAGGSYRVGVLGFT